MKTNAKNITPGILFLLIIVAMLTGFIGCQGQQGAKEKRDTKEKAVEAPAETAEPGGAVESPPPAQVAVDPKDLYQGDPEKDVADMVLDACKKLFGDKASSMYISVQDEKFRSPEIWIWRCEIEGDHGPVGVAIVRLDLGYIESFNVYQDYTLKAVRAGEDLPTTIAKKFNIEELGFVFDAVHSVPGRAIYEKYAEIGGYEVAIGEMSILYVPKNGDFIGIERHGYDLLDGIEMNFDREVATKLAAETIGDPTLQPDFAGLMQIQDGESRLKDLNIYWEFRFGDRWVYIRCKDGKVIYNPESPTVPINF